jgi:hypothetical protein
MALGTVSNSMARSRSPIPRLRGSPRAIAAERAAAALAATRAVQEAARLSARQVDKEAAQAACLADTRVASRGAGGKREARVLNNNPTNRCGLTYVWW